MATFTNWSGSVSWTPGETVEPRTADEVAAVVRRARETGRTVRPVGARHSSSPVAATDGVTVSTDGLQGLVDHDPDALTATVLPGTRLHDATDAFATLGMSMDNMGDIDLQAVAGAFATGTHGSGLRRPNLSASLVGGELVTGAGDVVRFGTDADGSAPVADDELLRAARVHLGALGVLTRLTLQLVEQHALHRRDWCTHVDWALEHYDAMARAHRSFDMYWYPRSDQAQVRTLNLPGEVPDVAPHGAPLHDEDLGANHHVIPHHRELRFEEMEYMLPYDAGLECFREVRARIKERHRRTVAWRVLVRTVAADDGLLSTCEGRDTMTIALLHNAGLPHDEYFGDLEPVLRSYGGRPHWGKKHTATAADLRDRYPHWDAFQGVRRTLDPDGVMLNDHLRTLLEDA